MHTSAKCITLISNAERGMDVRPLGLPLCIRHDQESGSQRLQNDVVGK